MKLFNMTFFRNGEEIISSDSVIIRDQRLHVLHVGTEDNGSYDCLAWNEAGTAENDNKFHLTVESESIYSC